MTTRYQGLQGLQGLHDYLARNFSNYHNIEMVRDLTEAIAFGCVRKSVELAKERGAYPAFKGSRWDTGEQLEQYKKNSNNKFDWDEQQRLMDLYGVVIFVM